MKSRTFYGLAAVTAVAVVAAVVSVSNQRAPTRIPADRPAAFPDLAAKVNDVAAIEVRAGKDKFTVRREGERWGLVEKGGYPVPFEKVKGAIVGLANLKLLEPKTSDPERYARLQLEDPAKDDAKSRQIVLKDASGKDIAGAVIGKKNANLFGSTRGGTYLRRGGDPASWLAEGEVEIGATPNDWIEREIADIAQEKIADVTVAHPGGETLHLHKPSAEAKTYGVDNIPEGRKLKSDSEPNTVAGALWRLRLEDVKPASQVTLPADHVVATYKTFDGLQVKVDMAKIGEEYWAVFEATPPAAAPPKPAADAKPEDAKKDEAKKDEAAADPAKLAADLNARVKGWAYRLSSYDAEKIVKKVADLLEEPAPAGKS
ncbi:MAG: DUF4340 domain-containing protein [Rhodospirillales bacterium]